METAMAQFAPMFVGLGVVGALMVQVSAHFGLIEWRQIKRRCPSCGRLIEGRVCAKCTGECA
jgi:hypothetical protein